MQNIPKKIHGVPIKKIFIPGDTKNDVVVNMDYSGAELRILAAYAPDPDLIRVLKDPQEDIHSLFTHRISAATATANSPVIPYRDIVLVRMEDGDAGKLSSAEQAHRLAIMHLKDEYEEARRKAKRTVFGTLYGMTKLRLSNDLKVSEEEAQGIIDGLMRAFPLIDDYIRSTRDEVYRTGEVATLIGRKRRFPLRNLPGMFNAACREAVNFKIQSTASDIVFGQLIEIANHIVTIGGTVRITVHDSIVFTIPKARLREVVPFLDYWAQARVQERYPWLPVPMRYDLEVGPSYGETEPFDAYMERHGL